MRKRIVLLAGIFLCLVGNLSAQTVTPDVANFSFTVNAATNDVVFTNTSVLGNAPGNRKAFWHFGDGSVTQTGPLQGTQHHYANAGTYTVCLKIYRYGFNSNDSVLTASECRTITLSSAVCTANFESPGTTPTGGPGRYFVAEPGHSQNKKPVRICWNFGDGRDTCIQYPASYTGPYGVYHLYNNPGNYNVCVNILYDGGCQATKCKIVEVTGADSCRANFERIELASTANPLQATFKALPWHSNNKKPVYICWSFGDNRDTCIQYSNTYTGPYTVNHLYNQPGIYNVCVRIVYQGGCDARKCETIRIGRPDSCSADFERLGLTTSNNQLTTVFKALPYHNNNKKPARICWTFGDGRDTCIDYLNIYNGLYTVAHTYSQPGQYEVCVKIIYQGGCEARKCRVVSVPPPVTCAADFERIPVASTNNPLHTYFKALPSHSQNKKPQKICWTFGDGRDTCINYTETYTGVYGVGHQYSQPGNYEVCVKILYFGGCEARKCRVIELERPDSCRADFERLPLVAGTTNSPLTAGFKAIPWHSNNKKPVKICWTFGDGRDTCITYPPDYNGPYGVIHHYTQPGQYEVCVKILYQGGCEARKCRVITIPPPQPACSVNLFEITPSISSLNRGFLAVPHSDPPRRVVQICWNFGDGTDTCINFTPNQPSPDLGIRHNYPGPGIYRACVRVKFEGGCVAEKCIEVVIRGHNNTNLCGGYMTDSLVGLRTVKFKGFSIANPNDEVLHYRWSFGDGSTAVGREQTHTYAAPGEYRVCLNIKTRSGCETNICKTVRVPGPTQATLVLTPNPVVTVLNAVYLSTHTEPVTIRIMNGFGTAVRTYTRNAVTGPNTWSFDLASLIPGIYTFIVQSPNQLASAIFIKN